MKKDKAVVCRFWVVGILAVVLIMDYVKANISYKKYFKENKFIKRRNRFPYIRKCLIGAEGGSQNKCAVKRG